MEQENRKVLISFKVSTLVLVVLGIIVLIIIGNIVSSFIRDSKTETTINKDLTAEANEHEEDYRTPVTPTPTLKQISSRSLEHSRTENMELVRLQQSEPIEEEIIEETAEEEAIEEPVIETTPIDQVSIAKDMDLTSRTGLSKEDFVTLISTVEQDTSGFFKENAELIYDVCEKYSLNEVFFCGLISAESGWNISNNHRRTHNYISLMSSKGLISYSSVEEGMEVAAKTLHEKYLTPGGCFYYGSTLTAMKTKFCPASSTWVNLVYQRMLQVLN